MIRRVFAALRILLTGTIVLAAGGSAMRAQTGSPFVSGAWCGNVTRTSATVNIRLNAPALPVRLVVSVNSQLTPALFSPVETTSAASGHSVSLGVDGLQPGTDYHYGIEVGGVVRPEAISRGRFRTFPSGAASLRIAFSSCGDLNDTDQRAFDAIVEEQPALFIHMGDLHYSDTNSTQVEDYRRNYDLVLNHRNQGALYRSVAVAYMWDDHDFTGNNTDGTATGTAAARTAYRERVPHYPITIPGGTIGQAFTIGRIRVIMTDLRSAAAPATTAESPTKSRMGAAQKAWFKQELLMARDLGFPLILWVNTVPWIAASQLGSDTWAGYATERTEIANFIRDNRIMNVALLSGDMHALAYDDGTNSDYATGGGAPMVVLQGGPLTRVPEPKGGPYSAGPVLGVGQYGLLDITDNGGPTVQCRFMGKRVGEGAKLVFQFSATATGVVPTVISGGGGNDRAFVNISTRGRITGPNDSVIVGFVIGGTVPRTILLRAVGPSLGAFGVLDGIQRPAITLFRGSTIVASNDNWRVADVERLNTAFDRAGAFRLGTSSSDAALLLALTPGAYTMAAAGVAGSTGTILAEAYELP